jgi:hypothetical protein
VGSAMEGREPDQPQGRPVHIWEEGWELSAPSLESIGDQIAGAALDAFSERIRERLRETDRSPSSPG